MRKALGWGLGALFALAVGCGDDGGSTNLDEAPAAVAESICNPLEECLGDLTELFLGGVSCTEAIEPGLANGNAPLWQESIDAGRLAFDGSKLSDCIDAASRLGCEALRARDIPACEEAFEGLVEPGGACVAEVDCAGEAFCAFDGACPGVCTRRAGGGESCAVAEECQSGFVCSGGSCVTPSGAGESCGGGSAVVCEDGLLCTGEGDMEPGVCKAFDDVFVQPLGADCNLVDGLDPLCEPGLSCVVESFDFATMEVIQVCASPSSSGGACNLGFPEVCPVGEYCDADPMTGAFEGDCVPLPASGEPCRDVDEGLGQPCAPAHACVGGTCRALQTNGASCSEDGECYSGSCEGSLCAAPACL